jgi:N-acetylglutamate synthase-like GNAT family acetyltransferase
VTAAIRPATPADVPAIATLVERAYAPYVPRIGGRPGPMDDDYAEQVAAGQVEVLDDEGTIRGVVVTIPHDDHLLIHNVAVDPDHHNTGLGSRLLDHAEAKAQRHEARLYTHILMTENQERYRRRGYVETHRDAQRVFMAKRLPPPG